MKNIKTLFCCLSALLLGSCQTVVEVDIPEHEPKLVVNAVFNPDSLFTVDVSASQSAFSNKEYVSVMSATVSLYQGGKHLFDFPYVGKGIYKADQKPKALHQYELKVSAAGFPDASALSQVPAAPALYNVQASEAPPYDDWQGASLNASFTLKDEPEQENYYYLQIFEPDTSRDGEPYNRYVHLHSVSPIDMEFSMETRLFFSDKLFNGEELPLKLKLENHPKRVTHVQVAQITKEYYLYVQTLKKQSYSDNLNINPEPVTNNILNGMGLFAAYNSCTLLFTVE